MHIWLFAIWLINILRHTKKSKTSNIYILHLSAHFIVTGWHIFSASTLLLVYNYNKVLSFSCLFPLNIARVSLGLYLLSDIISVSHRILDWVLHLIPLWQKVVSYILSVYWIILKVSLAAIPCSPGMPARYSPALIISVLQHKCIGLCEVDSVMSS